MNYKQEIRTNTLKQCRIERGLRQQDVADMLGLKATDRISHWEKGSAVPGLVNLSRLCAVYGKTVKDLYPELFIKISKNLNR